jgi:hypothetical protein
LKIYSHINASCGACIGQIKKWDSYAKQTKAKVFLILSSEDNFFMFKYLCDSMVDMRSFQHPFFFDTQNKFVSLNPFMKNSVHFETVLTDRKNNILLMGNPILSKKIKDLYETTIRENHEKNILNEFVY